MAPLRLSALHRCHLESQAHMDTFSGWELPAWYTESSREVEVVRGSVGISDASYLYKLDFHGQAEELHLPLAPPARLWKLTPSHALITSSRVNRFCSLVIRHQRYLPVQHDSAGRSKITGSAAEADYVERPRRLDA